MGDRCSRRALMAAALAASMTRLGVAAAQSETAFSFPIGWPGRALGDGFFIKHGYACENPTYYPGMSHTGENWYALEGNAAGAGVYAVAAGEVVYADSDYPGRVVIVRHASDLYSMYGHLAYDLAVTAGQAVERGTLLGTVLARADNPPRNHLHFELRIFLIEDIVNGDHPAYGQTCGVHCPPGPGYWPLARPEHPSDLGWLNPTHLIAARMFPDGPRAAEARVIVPAVPSAATTTLWTKPADLPGAEPLGDLALMAGAEYPLLAVSTRSPATRRRDAAAYRLWNRIELPTGDRAWMQAAVPSAIDRGLAGQPASVVFDLLPRVGEG